MSHGQNAYVVSYGIATPATAMEIVIYILLKTAEAENCSTKV